MNIANKKYILEKIWLFLLCGVAATIVFSLLNLNSVCIILLCIAWIAEASFREKWLILKKDKLVITYCLYFALQVAGMLYTTDLNTGWNHIEGKAGFLALPVILSSTQFRKEALRKKVMLFFTFCILIASLYCLTADLVNYYHTGNAGIFFYHDLVSPISQHAVYFSAFVSIALLFLIEEYKSAWMQKYRLLYFIAVIFLVGFLFLLSSKLIITIFLVFLLYIWWRNRTNRKISLPFIGIFLFFCILLFSITPVKKRFADIFRNDAVSVLKKQDFSTTYFNGLDFRLLQWRIVYETLKENNAWVLGLSPGDAQSYLNKKYASLKMYMGNEALHDVGYTNYNTHNQFLQILLQSGLAGLLLLIYWCGQWFSYARKAKDLVLTGIIVIIVCFFVSESVFERQFGVILSTFFPLIYYYFRNREMPA